MFFAIPLENKPSWRNPPWATVLIILVNIAVFFGPQRQEERAQDRATEFYAESELPGIEFEPFFKHLKDHPLKDLPVEMVRAAAKAGSVETVLTVMRREKTFLARLHRNEVITPTHPRFTVWQRARAAYEALIPPPFTERWSKDFRAPLLDRPQTWITSAFLHADTGHLVGNMVFLFLFGFTVELALGRLWYLSFYLLGAVGASLLSGWMYAGQMGYGLGASGAISALMSMYAVLYRFRKINFFYSFLFYFNVVRAPAIILLPLWIANEVTQHFFAHSNVGYMTHLGGLLTGAALMLSVSTARTATVVVTPPTREERFQEQVEQANALSASMKLEESCAAWSRAVRLQPDNLMALEKYFNTAALWPGKDHFHHAAALVFKLRASDQAVLDFQHRAFQTYFDKAKPNARLKAADMARLCKRFALAGFMDDAGKLCKALFATDPNHPEAVDLMCVCANASLRAQQTDAALGWLPALERHAPQHPTTARLRELQGTQGRSAA